MTTFVVSSGIVSSGITLYAGDSETVLAGGTTIQTTVNSGGLLTVEAQSVGIVQAGPVGTAKLTTVNSGGTEILSGGFGSDTTVAGGSLILSGAVASNTMVSNGGAVSLLDDSLAFGVTVNSGGSVTASDFSATINSGGSVTASDSGEVNIFTMSSGGSVAILSAGSAVLGLENTAPSSGEITFSGSPGTLSIYGKAMPGSLISGFGPGDEIFLASIFFDSAGTTTLTAGNVLQITEGGATYSLNFDPAQDFTGVNFNLTTSGSGTLLEVCFCRGTHILTDRGEVAVEGLAVGDRVKTLSGAVKPIVWIGCGRELVTRRHTLARPIVVRRSAVAANVPHRDLYLTHGHALYFDGVLIPVENLVNYRSIAWDDTARVVEYYHIELEDHDVVIAEGAPAESYYDAGNRAFFQNTRAEAHIGAAKPPCAPVLQTGDVVDKVWAELFARAGGRLERNTTQDADLHLVVDGQRLDPKASDGCVYVFGLERPPVASLRLRSRSGVPSLLGLDRSDHRRLGVPLEQIALYHAGIPTCFDYDAPQLREGGCHPPEDSYSWTDGEFELPARFFDSLDGALTLLVRTRRHRMRYPVAARALAA